MEALARELKCGIDIICMGYYYHKETNVILKARELADRVSRFCGAFLQGNIYDMDEEVVDVKRWSNLRNVRAYYDFFKKHEAEFEE